MFDKHTDNVVVFVYEIAQPITDIGNGVVAGIESGNVTHDRGKGFSFDFTMPSTVRTEMQ